MPESVTDCRDCGLCCQHVGVPLGYSFFYPRDGQTPAWVYETPDYARWRALPPEAEAELRTYYDGRAAGTIVDRSADNETPCLWYDEATKQCRYYEHRPEVCRDAIAPGDESCLEFRAARRYSLPLL